MVDGKLSDSDSFTYYFRDNNGRVAFTVVPVPGRTQPYDPLSSEEKRRSQKRAKRMRRKLETKTRGGSEEPTAVLGAVKRKLYSRSSKVVEDVAYATLISTANIE